MTADMQELEYDRGEPLGGFDWLRPGDVFEFCGREFVVDKVSLSNAHALPLNRTERVIKPGKFSERQEPVVVQSWGEPVAVSRQMQKELIKRRLGDQGLKDLLAERDSRRPAAVKPTEESKAENETGEDDMEAKQRKIKPVTKRKPRGGLAADAAADANGSTSKAKATNGKATSRLGKLFDHSVTSVIRTLGANGVKPDGMRAILKENKIEMSDASMLVQLGFGRNGKPGAELTKDQIAELKALVPAAE